MNALQIIRSLFYGLLVCLAGQSRAQRIDWPNGAKAAICLTYDDGMSSQLDQAIPVLDSGNLPATFFLNSLSDNRLADQWRKAAQKGHELANHTLFHPCLASRGWKPEWALDNYTVGRLLKEIQSMNSQLYLLDGKTTNRTFAFPCGDTTAGGVSYLDTLRRSGLVSYGRGGGNTDAVVTDFTALDGLQVPSFAVQPTNTAADLIEYAEKTAQQGGLGVYMFHGVGSQWIAISTIDHKKLVEYLSQHRQTYWVTTFHEALDYVTQWKKSHAPATHK